MTANSQLLTTTPKTKTKAYNYNRNRTTEMVEYGCKIEEKVEVYAK